MGDKVTIFARFHDDFDVHGLRLSFRGRCLKRTDFFHPIKESTEVSALKIIIERHSACNVSIRLFDVESYLLFNLLVELQ